MVLHVSSRRASKKSKLCAITTTADNLFHGVITSTVKKPARAAQAILLLKLLLDEVDYVN